MANEKKMLGGAVRRMLNRKLSMAFEKWQTEAAQMSHEKKMLGGAIRRLLHRKLSMAWEQWQQMANETKWQQQLLQGGATVEISTKGIRLRVHHVGCCFLSATAIGRVWGILEGACHVGGMPCRAGPCRAGAALNWSFGPCRE